MTEPIHFNSGEIALLSDSQLLLEKRNIQHKITHLLSGLQKYLAEKCPTKLSKEQFALFSPPKISKGENYKGLPYHVLDFPAIFENDNILTFRTMFYWGNFFSATLHLQGKFLDQNRKKLRDNLELLLATECFICVNNTPWEYEYTDANYEKLSLAHKDKFSHDPFIKLSIRIPLEDYPILNDKVGNFYFTMLPLLKISS